MKTKRKAKLNMQIVLVAIMAMVALCILAVMPSKQGVQADELSSLVLEEFDKWSADGWKIEKQSGIKKITSGEPAVEVDHPYDYVLTVADKIDFLLSTGDDVNKINNVSSRKLDFLLKTQAGTPLTGNPAITSSSWHKFTSTDATIGALKSYKATASVRHINVELGDNDADTGYHKVGETVLTVTMTNRTVGTEVVNGSVSVLYRCVERPTEKFTFTNVEKDRNDNKNAVWLNGISIPTADSEWTKTEEVGLGETKTFFQNVFYLEADVDSKPQAITLENLAGKDLFTMMNGAENRMAGKPKFQTEVRDDHIELKKQVRTTDGGGPEENGSPIDFEEGDAFYFKAGMFLPGHDGNNNWTPHEVGFVFSELLRDQYFVYKGETEGWSTDYLGISISFENASVSVDNGANLKLLPIVSGGEGLSEEIKKITWKSDNTDIATVAQDGTVTGLKKGTVTITATTGTGDFATIVVEVMESSEITAIRLNAATVNLNIGGTRQITETVEGGTAADKTVTWVTSDPAIATVNNGLITAVAAGTCTITATASDGKTATANVTVRAGAVEPGDDPDDTKDPDDKDKETSGCGNILFFGISGGVATIVLFGLVLFMLMRRKGNEKG